MGKGKAETCKPMLTVALADTQQGGHLTSNKTNNNENELWGEPGYISIFWLRPNFLFMPIHRLSKQLLDETRSHTKAGNQEDQELMLKILIFGAREPHTNHKLLKLVDATNQWIIPYQLTNITRNSSPTNYCNHININTSEAHEFINIATQVVQKHTIEIRARS